MLPRGACSLVPLLLAACAVSNVSNPFKSSDECVSAPRQPGPAARQMAKADSPQLALPEWRQPALSASGGLAARPALNHLRRRASRRSARPIVHRGEITKIARECQIYGDRVMVKYGFAGRVLLGPKGSAGHGDATRQHQGRRCGPQGARQRQDERVDHHSAGESGRLFLHGARRSPSPSCIGTRPEDYKVFVAFERTQAGAG